LKKVSDKTGYLILALALPGLFLTTAAQDSSPSDHIIGMQFGVNQIKEENLHPKAHTGTLLVLSYGYEKRAKVWHQFQFSMGYSRLKTELEDVSKSVNLKLNMAYSWNYPLVKKEHFEYYLGPEASAAYSASFLPNWDDSHLYWADYYSLGIRNSFSVMTSKETEWVTFVSLPLFSVFSRPPLYRLYKIDETDFSGILHNLNSNLAPAHLTNVFYFKLQTEYRFPVWVRKRQAFSFTIEYLHMRHDEGNAFSQLMYQLGIKLFL
jgi:hypothetical protein